MNHLYQHRYCATASVVVLLAAISVSALAQDTVTVQRVENATMFTTTSNDVIHLLGISIPEKQAYTHGKCRDVLKELIEGKQVILIKDSISKKDAWYVFLNDELMNTAMLRLGAAATARGTHSRMIEFKAAYYQAKNQKIGNWGEDTQLKKAVQCEGFTHENERCKNKTTDSSRRCPHHQ